MNSFPTETFCYVKEVPRGHPECLTGKAFVITGVLESLWRSEAEDLIKRHSGRVTTAVSGKTNFLVSGDQPGKSKTALVRDAITACCKFASYC